MSGSELNKDNLSFITPYCKRFIFNLTNNGAKYFSYSKNKELSQKLYTRIPFHTCPLIQTMMRALALKGYSPNESHHLLHYMFAECYDHEEFLDMHFNYCFSNQGCTKESPKRYKKVSTCYSSQIKQRIWN